MPASFAGVPALLRPPFGDAPQPSTFANANRASLYDSAAASDARVNLVPNPSFEYDLLGWSSYGAANTPTRVTTQPYSGSYCAKFVTNAASGNAGIVNAARIPLTGGTTTYTASAWVRNDSANVTNRTMQMFWYVYDTNNLQINGGVGGSGTSSATTAVGSAWTRLSITSAVAANATSMVLYINCVSAGTIGDTGYVDGVALERGTGGAYFDGDSPGSAWMPSAPDDGGGNLLTADGASFETSTGGWSGGTNCTVARSTARALDGTASLLATQTSASPTYYQVVGATLSGLAGKTCTFEAWVYPTSANDTVAVLQIGQTGIGNINGQILALTANTWNRIRYVVTFAANVTTIGLQIVITNTTGTGTSYIDQCGMWVGAGGDWALPGTPIQNLGRGVSPSSGPARPTTRTNLALNPSFEVDTLQWINAGGSTIARATADAYVGTACVLHTSNTASASTYLASNLTSGGGRYSVTGTTVTLSAYVKSVTGLRPYEARIYWYDAAGTNITSTAGSTFATTTTSWTRVWGTFVVPSTATTCTLTIMTRGTGAIGDSAYIDAVLYEESASLGSYFDGTTAGASYGGGVSNSISVLPVAAPVRVGASRGVSDSLTVSDAVSSVYGRSRTVGDTVTLTPTLFVDVIFATLPVHMAGVGAGVSLAGVPGASQAQGNPGGSASLGDAGTVYANGKPNRVEASR